MNKAQEFKSGEIARALNVNPNTIRSWADTYGEFLSNRATAAKRTYTPDDFLVLSTIAELRKSGLSFDAIRDALRNGQRIDTPPDVPTAQEVERKEQEGIVLQSEHDGVKVQLEQEKEYRHYLENQLAIVTSKRDELQQRLETETSDIRQAWRTEVDTLNKQVIDLTGQLEAAKAQVTIIQQERQPAAYWLRVIVVIVAIAILLTIIISVVLNSG